MNQTNYEAMRKKSQGQIRATRTVYNTRRAAKRYEARAMVTLSLRQQLEAGAPSASSARKATARVATRRSDVQRRRREGQRAHISPLGSVAPRAQHLPQALEQPPLLNLVLERLRGGGRLLEDGRREAGELGDVDACSRSGRCEEAPPSSRGGAGRRRGQGEGRRAIGCRRRAGSGRGR